MLTGWKTYLAAAGLAVLAVYHVCVRNVEAAVQMFLHALTAAGLRHAITRHGLAGAYVADESDLAEAPPARHPAKGHGRRAH